MTSDAQEDKVVELCRYDSRARNLLARPREVREDLCVGGATSVELIFRSPYLYYEQCIRNLVRSGHEVLELGAGTGFHSRVLLSTGARVTVTDLSPNALRALEQNVREYGGERLRTHIADIEALPFGDASFDVVACAGSLSYGDPVAVDAGVQRVLRPGGAFICVDSLNHNPIYRLNRWMHYLRGDRTRSTLVRMPTVERVQSIVGHFEAADVCYFGAVSYAMPILARMVGPERASSISDTCDRLLNARRSAFKYPRAARGRQ